jgi:hypothetical protein
MTLGVADFMRVLFPAARTTATGWLMASFLNQKPGFRPLVCLERFPGRIFVTINSAVNPNPKPGNRTLGLD